MPKNKTRQKLKIYDLESNIFAEFGRGIKLGIINLWRNRLLSLATILVMAIMICIFNTIFAVNLISRQALSTLNQKVDLVFYLKEGTDYYNANLLASKIRDIPGVKKVEYISKEKALQIISKTYPETAEFLTKFNLRNPLPASLSVTTESAETHKAVYDFVKKSTLNQFIDSNQNNRTDNQNILSSTADNLISINNFVKQLIFWIVFVFIIGGALIVINAIQLTIFTRRNEIFVMRLVGATPNFIRLPFLTEGVCYALIAVTLSFLLLYFGGQALGLENLQLIKEISNINLINIFLAELGLAALLSLLSSLIAVEKYLRGQLVYN